MATRMAVIYVCFGAGLAAVLAAALSALVLSPWAFAFAGIAAGCGLGVWLASIFQIDAENRARRTSL
jgi:F0F1-type ATP synthase membrane subunit c/vacuolar-type H+-ATPase subunit K